MSDFVDETQEDEIETLECEGCQCDFDREEMNWDDDGTYCDDCWEEKQRENEVPQV